jgi:hypothetical protein
LAPPAPNGNFSSRQTRHLPGTREAPLAVPESHPARKRRFERFSGPGF